MDCNPPDFSVRGIFHARILKWVAISSSRGSSWPRIQTHIFYVSCIAGGFFTLSHQGKLSLRMCSNSCPLSHWCCLTISSSAAPFFFCLQSLPASGSFLISWLFTSGGQSIEASASATILPKNIQGWFPLELTIDWQYNLNILFYVMIRVSLKRLKFSGISVIICFVFMLRKEKLAMWE